MDYDPSTGWTHLSATEVWAEWRLLAGAPDPFEQVALTGLDYYRDARGGLYVRCELGRALGILSGLPSDDEPLPRVKPQTRWLSIADLGAALGGPRMADVSVLRLLRQAGLLERVEGKDEPTRAAKGLFRKESPEDMDSPGFRQQRWAYEVIEILVRLPPKKSKPSRPKKMTEKQADVLRALYEQAREPFDGSLTRTEATAQIRFMRRWVEELLPYFDRSPASNKPMTAVQRRCLEISYGKPFNEKLTIKEAARWLHEESEGVKKRETGGSKRQIWDAG